MKAFMSRMLNVMWYAWLITVIANHSNTIGIQLLALFALIFSAVADLHFMVKTQPVVKT